MNYVILAGRKHILLLLLFIIYYSILLFIIPISDCADAYGNDLIPEMMICAGEDGKDSCQVIVKHTHTHTHTH